MVVAKEQGRETVDAHDVGPDARLSSSAHCSSFEVHLMHGLIRREVRLD